MFINQEEDYDEVEGEVKTGLEGYHVSLDLRELAIWLVKYILTYYHVALVIDISKYRIAHYEPDLFGILFVDISLVQTQVVTFLLLLLNGPNGFIYLFKACCPLKLKHLVDVLISTY